MPLGRRPLSMKRILACLPLAALALLAAGPARAQVAASLVCANASISPGTPFTVALRLVHQPHWHTYWVNPGTGLATTLKWTLPLGWKAGDIQWPAPMLLSDSRGNIIGNGYDGDLFLPVTITPPPDAKPGTDAELRVAADWLMCQDECVPGSAKLSLTLPILEGEARPDATYAAPIQGALARIPAADPQWEVFASRKTTTVTLTVRPRGGAGKPRTAAGLHFFSQDGTIAYDLPQPASSVSGGGFKLVLPVSPDGPEDARRLVGVLTSTEGWRPDGSLPGLAMDAPFGGSRGPASAAGGAPPRPREASSARSSSPLPGG